MDFERKKTLVLGNFYLFLQVVILWTYGDSPQNKLILIFGRIPCRDSNYECTIKLCGIIYVTVEFIAFGVNYQPQGQ